MSMAPSVESSSFSQYSSNPTPPVTTGGGVGTTGWLKEHALIILLGVISLVAVLWFIARRSSSGSASLSSDNGYPLGYPSTGAGTSGGSGASSGSSGSGSGDTGAGATASDQAIKDFEAGFALRDGQINSAGTTTATVAPIPVNVHLTQDPIAVNVGGTVSVQGATGPQGIQGIQGIPGIQPLVKKAPTQTLSAAVAVPVASAIQSHGIPALITSLAPSFPASTGTHVATTNKPKTAPKKTPPKKPSTNQKGTRAPREV